MSSFLKANVLIKPSTHCGVNAELIACQNRTNNDCLCLSCTLKVNGLLLAHLGLEISCQERVQHKTMLDVKLLQTSVSFPGNMIP